MKDRKERSPEMQREAFMEQFHGALQKRPTISDEEFLAETEVSDEEYTLGLVLPGVGYKKGGVDE